MGKYLCSLETRRRGSMEKKLCPSMKSICGICSRINCKRGSVDVSTGTTVVLYDDDDEPYLLYKVLDAVDPVKDRFFSSRSYEHYNYNEWENALFGAADVEFDKVDCKRLREDAIQFILSKELDHPSLYAFLCYLLDCWKVHSIEDYGLDWIVVFSSRWWDVWMAALKDGSDRLPGCGKFVRFIIRSKSLAYLSFKVFCIRASLSRTLQHWRYRLERTFNRKLRKEEAAFNLEMDAILEKISD